MVRRGEVWLTSLDPTVGSEIQKTRPCLVISPDTLNERLSTVTIAPMTSGSRPARFRVETTFEGVNGFVLPEQSRAIDKRRLIRRLGVLDDAALRQVLGILVKFYTE